MAQITSYATLTAEIQNYIHRGDLSSEIDVWIGVVESELNLELRTRQQLTSTTLSATTNTVALPADFLQMRNLELGTIPTNPLKYVTSEQRDLYDRQSSSGQPRIYDIVGTNLFLSPAPDQTYTLNIEYYSKIPGLISNTTNWLITNFPHLYLYGCLQQAAGFITDAARLQVYFQAYEKAKAQLSKADDDAVYNSSPRLRADVGW